MPRFSERIGVVPVRDAIQVRSLNEATRNRLWNAITESIPYAPHREFTWPRLLFLDIWGNFFKKSVDSMPQMDSDIRIHLRNVVTQREWYTPYELIEFILDSAHPGRATKLALRTKVSTILEEELAGCRFLQGMFVEITDETEIATIEEAFRSTSVDRFAPVHEHLQTALTLLSDRKSPDVRNSMKESISAVAAAIQILTGDPKADLSAGLKLLRTKAPVHGALRKALVSMYGYTSDADGIRHPLSDEPELDSADAKFMLVACSAFVLYLIAKAN